MLITTPPRLIAYMYTGHYGPVSSYTSTKDRPIQRPPWPEAINYSDTESNFPNLGSNAQNLIITEQPEFIIINNLHYQ